MISLTIKPGTVHAIIPSRGDVPIASLVANLRNCPEIGLVSFECGSTPFNRYRAAMRSDFPLIWTQDDDCITDPRPAFEAWIAREVWHDEVLPSQEYPAGAIVNCMTIEHAARYPGRETLIGFGALFNRNTAYCMQSWERDELFFRESDRVFGTITRHVTVYPEIIILPWAHHENRLWKQSDHVSARDAMRARILEKTGIHHGGR